MEKWQKYNQKLLAVGGTLVIVLIVSVVLVTGVLLITELINSRRSYRIEDHSLTIESSDTANTGLVVKKDISFDRPQLIDTLAEIYLIPVSQVNLEKPEFIASDSRVSQTSEKSAYDYHTKFKYFGAFNNLMIYDAAKDEQKFLFDERIYIPGFSAEVIAGNVYLIIQGVVNDTDGNGKLNSDDLQDLYIYGLKDRQLAKFSFSGMSYDDFYVLNRKAEMLLSWFEDKNNDGIIQYGQEPQRLKVLNLSDYEIVDFVSEDKILQLKALIN
jgi:hypothetical protein